MTNIEIFPRDRHEVSTLTGALQFSRRSETLNFRQHSPTVLCYDYSVWVNFSTEEREEAFLYTVAPRGHQCAGYILPVLSVYQCQPQMIPASSHAQPANC